MTIPEAAASLGLSPNTLRHQIRLRKMRAHKMGYGWYVSPEEVERYRRESLGSRRLRPRPPVEDVVT
jgi:excisionase family DNA binding protein